MPKYQNPFITNDRQMAAVVRNAYAAFAGKGLHRLGIKRAYWYTWASSYQKGRALGFFEFAGLRRFAGGSASSRPALAAYAKAARKFEGCGKTAERLLPLAVGGRRAAARSARPETLLKR